MKERVFRFKQFSVCHALSAMKVGVDGVLVGAWAPLANLPSSPKILDVGTGCGLIALIMAQRCPTADILAVDIHQLSVEEARVNFSHSPWATRLAAFEMDFCKVKGKFHLIISNPPFFDSGISPDCSDSRMLARHASALSPVSLLSVGAQKLWPGGSIVQITPPEWLPRLMETAREAGLLLRNIARIRPVPEGLVRRIITCFSLSESADAAVEEDIIIQTAPETYTDQYRRLTGDFYLKF